MVTLARDLEVRLTDLRRAFDQTFGLLPGDAAADTEDVLAIRVAGDAYGLRIRDLAALAPIGRIVPFPSRRPGLLGLTGIRGNLTTVYGLASLLGYEVGRSNPRWLGVASGGDAMALAFDDLEGFLRLARSEICVNSSKAYVNEMVRTGDATRMLIDTPSLLAALRTQSEPSSSTKEK
jgi:chemotaxis signal transduction protein